MRTARRSPAALVQISFKQTGPAPGLFVPEDSEGPSTAVRGPGPHRSSAQILPVARCSWSAEYAACSPAHAGGSAQRLSEPYTRARAAAATEFVIKRKSAFIGIMLNTAPGAARRPPGTARACPPAPSRPAPTSRLAELVPGTVLPMLPSLSLDDVPVAPPNVTPDAPRAAAPGALSTAPGTPARAPSPPRRALTPVNQAEAVFVPLARPVLARCNSAPLAMPVLGRCKSAPAPPTPVMRSKKKRPGHTEWQRTPAKRRLSRCRAVSIS